MKTYEVRVTEKGQVITKVKIGDALLFSSVLHGYIETLHNIKRCLTINLN